MIQAIKSVNYEANTLKRILKAMLYASQKSE